MSAKSFSSVLVANRGEIAVRVLNEARDSGRTAIAVYSEADASALHVRQADLSVCIGPALASESYLNIDAVLDAAKKTGAQAIHPGYGFLSENAAFARAVIEAGLVWIGPPPEAIDAMGDKARAKELMIKAGVPTLPGWQGEDQSDANLKAEADKVGYPLLIKAVAGGGGRGMRIVRSAAEFAEALNSARREAKSAFGDDAVLIEKFVERGRHVEIQVFADLEGNSIHLGERDCSAQRRRQKVIEEAPSPAVNPELREKMGADAVAAAKAVGYVGAGTVEFLLDESGAYYFLEMNTRLQVEHPVTEEVTRTNLVQWQFEIASGAPLPLSQSDVTIEGWAIEARLYAEDPFNGFAPQSGLILAYDGDVSSAGGRVDAGVETGDMIGTDYDPMVSKVIGTGASRDEAIASLRAALKSDPLLGVTTNRDFLLALVDGEAFRTGAICTADLDLWAEEGTGPFAKPGSDPNAIALAAALLGAAPAGVIRSGSVSGFDLPLVVNGEAMTVRVEQIGPEAVSVAIEGEAAPRQVQLLDEDEPGEIAFRIDGVDRRAHVARSQDGALHIALGEQINAIAEASPWGADAASDPSKIIAPVSGAVVAVNVKPGDQVKAGDVLVVMEAMKMEMRLSAAANGEIASVNAQAGAQAANGAVLIELTLNSQE
ncbi:biotin carboxylase N-terminal domain-containing protein [Oceanicaulis sp. LC35]|uniref:acetyl/propionyl/methylcrotonyl-CoA carboxylase subunit alpha n=1 Tax=Oceanicaulis sp. LC35 TaxID=3349635 RepID=UPI003F865FC8